MAFIDIKDPRKRDQIVQDYVNTIKELQIRTENEKAGDLQQRMELEKQYSPLIEASKESTNRITKELKNNRVKEEEKEKEDKNKKKLTVKGYWQPSYGIPAIDYYLTLKSNLDRYYGIQKNGDKDGYVMGPERVDIDESSNIFVKNEKFEATPGLWELIMLNKPETWTPKDMSRYEDLLEKTQAIFNPITASKRDRPKTTNKYLKILAPIEGTYEKSGNDDGEEEEEEDEAGVGTSKADSVENIGEYHEEAKHEKKGEAIQYLPGDISGLLDQLKLLYAEREAGNISSTTNQIVGILDQLLRMNYINRVEYNAVCKALSC